MDIIGILGRNPQDYALSSIPSPYDDELGQGVMSSLALNENNPDRIEQGLLALLVEGFALDYQGSLLTLTLLVHSARKLHVDWEGIVRKHHITLQTPKSQKYLDAFLKDPKTIEQMRMAEASSRKGYRYKMNW